RPAGRPVAGRGWRPAGLDVAQSRTGVAGGGRRDRRGDRVPAVARPADRLVDPVQLTDRTGPRCPYGHRGPDVVSRRRGQAVTNSALYASRASVIGWK